MTQLFVPRVQFGVTDRISVGVGNVAFRPLGFVTPKVQLYKGNNVSAAVGVLHVFGISGLSGGVAYGVVTVDRPRQRSGPQWSFTGGAGVAYASGDAGGGRTMIASLGVEERRSEHSVNILHSYIHSAGAVVIASHRHTWTHWWVDYGIMVGVVLPHATIPGPVLSFGRKF